ncbi:hypothetical protein DUK53_08765 [Listeria sp. SHR_NRA_18]|uniref:hypothetical protein n=1 Tax=Listeria TaxID=1637 RepID=UPI00051D4BA4|nr:MULTISPECIES: hypothetical protein [Listeria]KGL46058.1 hypothetical protein EP56_02990 [Listeriaceae bacterium FSL A5-0209]KMT62581.1 hypothetical protein X559_1119 [Listeria newyorkensis]RQW66719.1 hypothetical protein DUK53_08765 [Listeria sp. SHR_NRA_18]
MSFKIAYEYDEKKVFVRDNIVFPTFIYVTDDGKEFDDSFKASIHQKELFPLQEVEIEHENLSENLDEGVEKGTVKEMVLMEPTNIPDVQTKEIFTLPSSCTWEPAPSPSNEAIWDNKKNKWVNGETPEMVPPTPSETELLSQDNADQLMHIAELDFKFEQSMQDNADMLLLIAEVM